MDVVVYAEVLGDILHAHSLSSSLYDSLELGLAGAQSNGLLRGTPLLEQMPATHNCPPGC